MSTYVVVEISPETTTRPVLTRVSQATRPYGSSRSTASSTVSEIWSAILSGWPSVTDSDVNRNVRSAIGARLASLHDGDERLHVPVARAVHHEGLERLQVRLEPRRDGLVGELRERLHGGQRVRDVDVQEPVRLVREPGDVQLVAVR